MSEHSKGPELEYDTGRGEFVASGVVVGFLVPDPRLGRTSVAVYERDALGRKMAAAPELVDLVRDAFATDAEIAARFQAETGQAPPDEAAEEEQTERRAEFDAWLTRYQLELTRRAKAALKRAGEEP